MNVVVTGAPRGSEKLWLSPSPGLDTPCWSSPGAKNACSPSARN